MFNPLTEIKSIWQEIPQTIQRFIKRAFVFFIVWKVVYMLILYPANIPDKQLRHATSWGTVQLLKWKYPESTFGIQSKVMTDTIFRITTESDIIFKDNKKVLGIADPCNALELYILYISFLFCFPEKIYRTIYFLIVGVLVIYIVNILRCFGVAWLNIQHSYVTEIAHHYVFKLAEYAAIFGLWMLYLRKQKYLVASENKH